MTIWKPVAYNIAFLAILGVITLFPLSWISTVIFPSAGMSSLMSAQGIRWFVGAFASIIGSEMLADIILIAMAVGILRDSYFAQSLRRCLLLAIALCLLLVLLGSMGDTLLCAIGTVSHSPLLHGAIPITCCCTVIVAATYGFVTSAFKTISDAFRAMSNGIAAAAPMLVLYVFAAQLFAVIKYVF